MVEFSSLCLQISIVLIFLMGIIMYRSILSIIIYRSQNAFFIFSVSFFLFLSIPDYIIFIMSKECQVIVAETVLKSLCI